MSSIDADCGGAGMTRIGPFLFLAIVCTALSASAAPKPKQASLKQVELNPDGFLGRRVIVEGWVGSAGKAAEPMAELTVLPNAKGRPGRLRFLAPKSLADQLPTTGDAKPAFLTGTVSAPESSQVGYTFEVEEIALSGTDGSTTVLTPAATAFPVESTPTLTDRKEPAATPAKPKSVEGGKKPDKLQDVLIIVASGLALFMIVSLAAGVRLMKHLKKQPAAGAS